MILRSRNIPELQELTKQHRHQVIANVERMVFCTSRSLWLVGALLVLGLAWQIACGWLFMRYESLWLLPATAPAIATFSGYSIYRLIGLNSFYQPAIKRIAAELPPERENRQMLSRLEKGMVMSFVLTVGCVLWLVISFGQR